jgi:hypothetical protein
MEHKELLAAKEPQVLKVLLVPKEFRGLKARRVYRASKGYKVGDLISFKEFKEA